MAVHASYEDGGGSLVLSVRGHLDPALREELQRACEGREATTGRLVVDLGGVTYLDSSGLDMLLALRRMVEADGGSGEVVLRHCPREVRWILEVVHFDRLFRIED
ncbi:STAS domain-containing protein [Halorhodospira neutriphila]|uniref:STAS domain-containing protein n=1 Tax=Halorhodospira neutriphila TaxID=168379 RepID=A0ABS1E2Z2_9GAMM|nr:STAS domain-containing protein [Halorhodospira neutriphila]MBK1725858.1 hypothetical protein [Halorhodospira neutriphila]